MGIVLGPSILNYLEGKPNEIQNNKSPRWRNAWGEGNGKKLFNDLRNCNNVIWYLTSTLDAGYGPQGRLMGGD